MDTQLIDEMAEMEKTYWWHVAKRRLLVGEIGRIFPGRDKSKIKILDAGCGTGALLADLETSGRELWGADVSAKSLAFARKKSKASLKRVDFNKRLPYRDETFDLVMCADALEHVAKDRFLLTEFRRILRPGGFVFLTVPAYMFLWSYWDKSLGHFRRYTCGELVQILKESGFMIRKATYFFSFLLPLALLLRALKKKMGQEGSDFVRVPAVLNKFLLAISILEQKVISFFSIPFGLSVFVVAGKAEKN